MDYCSYDQSIVLGRLKGDRNKQVSANICTTYENIHKLT